MPSQHLPKRTHKQEHWASRGGDVWDINWGSEPSFATADTKVGSAQETNSAKLRSQRLPERRDRP
jgi:hypothetical protein